VDQIARLLEGRVDHNERTIILAHLETCRRCREVYLDSAVEIGFLRVEGRTPSVRTKDLVGLGMRVPASVDTATRPRDGGPGSITVLGSWGSRKLRAVAIAASLVAVAAVGWYGARTLEHSRASSRVVQPIRTAVGEFSRKSELVLPGGESYLGKNEPVYRSLGGSINDPLAAALRNLLEKFLGGTSSPDEAYWLAAGYLSSGDVRTASIYVAAARERFPGDPRLRVLEGVVAYSDRDVDRAERLLRSFVTNDRNGPATDPLLAIAQIDLSIVLRDQGKEAEAREVLSDVQTRLAGTPIGKRAGILDSKLGS
jgi:hypothetical protein